MHLRYSLYRRCSQQGRPRPAGMGQSAPTDCPAFFANDAFAVKSSRYSLSAFGSPPLHLTNARRQTMANFRYVLLMVAETAPWPLNKILVPIVAALCPRSPHLPAPPPPPKRQPRQTPQDDNHSRRPERPPKLKRRPAWQQWRPRRNKRTRDKSIPQTHRIFHVKASLIRPEELSFYHILNKAIPRTTTLIPAVALHELFEDSAHYFRIEAMHVDFLICEGATLQPLIAIELDGSSHDAPKNRERHIRKNDVFKNAGFPLIRFQRKWQYNLADIRATIAERLPAYFNDPSNWPPA